MPMPVSGTVGEGGKLLYTARKEQWQQNCEKTEANSV